MMKIFFIIHFSLSSPGQQFYFLCMFDLLSASTDMRLKSCWAHWDGAGQKTQNLTKIIQTNTITVCDVLLQIIAANMQKNSYIFKNFAVDFYRIL